MNSSRPIQTVLVADDDSECRAFACAALGGRYPVLTASTGDEALRIARSTHPSAIVLDVLMPGGRDGFTVFCELKKYSETQDIPIIMLTEVNEKTRLSFDAAEILKCLGASPAAFIEKPARPEELRQAVAKALLETAGQKAAVGCLAEPEGVPGAASAWMRKGRCHESA